jgi:hypothetical protein
MSMSENGNTNDANIFDLLEGSGDNAEVEEDQESKEDSSLEEQPSEFDSELDYLKVDENREWTVPDHTKIKNAIIYECNDDIEFCIPFCVGYSQSNHIQYLWKSMTSSSPSFLRLIPTSSSYPMYWMLAFMLSKVAYKHIPSQLHPQWDKFCPIDACVDLPQLSNLHGV